MSIRTNNRNVAAYFARQQPATSSNGQFFSPDGRVLYSYGAHWPLAIWHDGKCYVNQDRANMTTSRHKSLVLHELPARVVEFVDHAEAKRLANAS